MTIALIKILQLSNLASIQLGFVAFSCSTVVQVIHRLSKQYFAVTETQTRRREYGTGGKWSRRKENKHGMGTEGEETGEESIRTEETERCRAKE